MKTFSINGETGQSKIILGESIKNLKDYCKKRKTLIITDNNVNSIYGHLFSEFNIVEIGLGEGIKNLRTAEFLYKKFLDFEIDRNSFIIGLGGGIVCDIAGFVASTYMRGVSFAFVPTTLLAQVDAGTGGKNGVNFEGYKNIIGLFNQPEFVLCDFNVLKTLPDKELRCGFAEVIKHAAIDNLAYFEFLEERWKEIISLDNREIQKVVYDSIDIKTKIVRSDEKEKNERKKLNFGHTMGHAIEKLTGLPHGEAVSAGMVLANNISLSGGMLSSEGSKRFIELLKKFNLPYEIDIKKDLLLDTIKKDKKRDSDYIDFILLEKIGRAKIVKIKINEINF